METTETKEQWTSIIKPRSGWFDIHPGEVWRYRDLIMLFVRRDFIAIYKQTILGPLWFLIQPLFSMIVFTVIFGKVAKIPTDGVPPLVFYLSGIVSWNYFSSCLVKIADIFKANESIFGKVYFPRLTVPISVVMTNLLTFMIQMSLFFMFYFYYYFTSSLIRPTLYLLLIPFLLLQMAALGLGFGILISSLTTKYRDLAYLIGFGAQLWMYATPVVYPMSIIPEKWKALFILNPMAVIVETFRFAFIGVGEFVPMYYIVSIGITVLILIIGLIFFNRIEKTFMDTV